MLRLHLAGSANDDLVLIREDAIVGVSAITTGPVPYTGILLESGSQFMVREPIEEVENAIAAAQSKGS